MFKLYTWPQSRHPHTCHYKHSIVTMRVTRVCVLLFCIIAAFTSVLASPALLRGETSKRLTSKRQSFHYPEFILNDHSSENCGTQNSLCGTDYTPDCCPHLSCSEVDGKIALIIMMNDTKQEHPLEFWICDIEKESNGEKWRHLIKTKTQRSYNSKLNEDVWLKRT